MKRSRPYPAALAALLLFCEPAAASFLSGETLDKAADVVAIIVLIVVPVIGVAVFWLVHILPEKIAEKRKHPQAAAVKVLCLLSLVFGGILWPLAWILAYTKPVLHKLAYGTDTHEEEGEAHETPRKEPVLGADGGTPAADELRELRQRLAALEATMAGGRAGGR